MTHQDQDQFWNRMSFVWRSSSKHEDIEINLDDLMNELENLAENLEKDLDNMDFKDIKSGIYIYGDPEDLKDLGIDENSVFGKWLKKMMKLFGK